MDDLTSRRQSAGDDHVHAHAPPGRATSASKEPHTGRQASHALDAEAVQVAAGQAASAPALDFTSPHFDAAKALYSDACVVPVPHAPLLDNLAKCRGLLPAEHPDSLRHVVPAVASEVRLTHACSAARCIALQ